MQGCSHMPKINKNSSNDEINSYFRAIRKYPGQNNRKFATPEAQEKQPLLNQKGKASSKVRSNGKAASKVRGPNDKAISKVVRDLRDLSSGVFALPYERQRESVDSQRSAAWFGENINHIPDSVKDQLADEIRSLIEGKQFVDSNMSLASSGSLYPAKLRMSSPSFRSSLSVNKADGSVPRLLPLEEKENNSGDDAKLTSSSLSSSSKSSESDDRDDEGEAKKYHEEFIKLLASIVQEAKSRETAEAASVVKAWLENREKSASAEVKEPKIVTKGVWQALKDVWNCSIPINLYCCQFNVKISSFLIQAISLTYGVVYAMVSKHKAEPVLGGVAYMFSIFSFLANYAQIDITLNNFGRDFINNFNNLLKFVGICIERLLCGAIQAKTIEESKIVKGLFGGLILICAGLAVCTATPIASATLEATGVEKLSWAMWALRSLLVLKSTVGLPDMLTAKLKSLYERWQQVENGDKSFIRASLESGFLGLSAYVASKYSLSQQETMGDYCVKELSALFEKMGIDLAGKEALFSELGIGPLFALNLVFILGGGETSLDLLDRFHPLLLITMLLAAPTGFPGIALIDTPGVMDKVNAYLAAFLSNWRSLEQLPYVVAKITKDRAISGMQDLSLLLGTIYNAYYNLYKEESVRLNKEESVRLKRWGGKQNSELLKECDAVSNYCFALQGILTEYTGKRDCSSKVVETIEKNLYKFDGGIYSVCRGLVKTAATGVYNAATSVTAFFKYSSSAQDPLVCLEEGRPIQR